jgi:spoIIIJ-associated protein
VRSVEAEGASVDEAIAVALQRLGAAQADVDVEVLSDASPSRVRVTLRAVSQETAAERLARDVLVETLRLLDLSCEVTTRPGDDPGTMLLSVSGTDEARVIGRHGQTLDALEYLLNRIVFRDHDATGRIVVDVDGYRDRREQSLAALAHRMAQRARETGHAVALDPMAPRDRRVIHLALKDDAAVTTRSEGEGRFRHLVIVPRTSGRPRS